MLLFETEQVDLRIHSKAQKQVKNFSIHCESIIISESNTLTSYFKSTTVLFM